MSWRAIWSGGGAVRQSQQPAESAGAATFLLEGRLAVAGEARNLWRGQNQGDLRISQDIDGALTLNQDGGAARLPLPGFAPGQAVRVAYRIPAARQPGRLDVQALSNGARATRAIGTATPMTLENVAPNAARGRFAFAAFADHDASIGDEAGLAQGAVVFTPGGASPVESLHPGAIVLTSEGSRAQVVEVVHRDAVCLGSLAPVRIRAPYFGLSDDIYLSRFLRLRLRGPEVEYVFGEPEVSVAAGDLVDGTSVIRDVSQPTRRFYQIKLDRPATLRIGRCRVETDDHGSTNCPKADRLSAQSLLALRRDQRDLIG